MEKEKSNSVVSVKKNIPFLMGIIILGIVSLIFGITTMRMYFSAGEWPTYETYGGDAYTGIQHASANAARNAYLTNKLLIELKNIVGFGFILIGISMMLLGLTLLISELTIRGYWPKLTLVKKDGKHEDNGTEKKTDGPNSNDN